MKGNKNMSKEYDEYLKEHIENVGTALNWMLRHDIIPESLNNDGWRWNWGATAISHDASKRSVEEYDAYDDYFYGKEGKDEDDISVIDSAFDYAWLHHIHNNPHHWQHWILYEDEGKIKALEMPAKEVYEMIADWWSFSWKSKNLSEMFNWYEEHKDKMVLHPNTRALVEKILEQIKAGIEKDHDIFKRAAEEIQGELKEDHA